MDTLVKMRDATCGEVWGW